ncbi:arylamine N-acetyltransferase, pineal gland isozyme NAT-10-like [Ambystoma mexicanum]|uniref:arylamine N-acetyltransferase, pineal gland isozyme NAT-10-like n=1 Tax=Ambystoma mexicanum TaxID=8296 RepID=UPI0037E78531
MNLEEYFSRIHFKGSSETCDYPTLKDILQKHIRAVPFESLSIQCGEAIELGIEAIYNKIVRKRRGGCCYEQNHLLFWVLKAMKYEVTMLGANVYLPLQEIYSPNMSHVMLKVVVDGQPYIVDAGFAASYQMWEPVEIISGKDQPQVPGIFRLTEVNGVWYFGQVRRKQYVPNQSFINTDLLDIAQYRKLYSFTLVDRTIEDFYPMFIYLQTSEDSLFKKKSICTLQLNDGVRALVGWTLAETKYNYKDNMDLVEFTNVKNEEVPKVLRDKFNLVLEKGFVPVNTSAFYTL